MASAISLFHSPVTARQAPQKNRADVRFGAYWPLAAMIDNVSGSCRVGEDGREFKPAYLESLEA